MELDEFACHPGRETARSSHVLRIIERKITDMRLSHLECGEWVDHLHNHERLRSIEVHNSRTEGSDEFDRKFWTAIAQLDNCRKVIVGDIPIPFNWSVQFRNVTNLQLFLFWFHIEIPEWIRTIKTVFKYMPELETLWLSSPYGSNFEQIIKTMEISDVACKKLKSLNLSGYAPRRLLVSIGNQCPNLVRCGLGVYNINDEDLLALSQCQRIRNFALETPSHITNGVAYLTHLPHLTNLDIHYYHGSYIDTRLLLDFARHCPCLDIIRVLNRTNLGDGSDPRPFETEDIADLFAAGAELRAYFEPRYRTPSDGDTEIEQSEPLEEYLIRIDNLRRDISLF